MVKLNIKKMRKNLDRNAPDEIRFRCDSMSDRDRARAHAKIEHFHRRMIKKYGPHARIHVIRDTDLASFIGEVVIICRYIKP